MDPTQKFLVWIADVFGLPICGVGFLNNLDNAKSAGFFIVGMIYAMARTFFYIVEKRDAKRLRDWEHEQRLKQKQ